MHHLANLPTDFGIDDTESPVVVGIGASAGGLEAVQELIATLTSESNRAYVLVQHLDPDHHSLLPELLSRRTDILIVPIEDGIRIEIGKFYLITAGTGLAVKDGVLHLSSFDTPRGLRRPIDVFLQSLASDYGTRSACIILSGTGSDGSAGAKAIKEAGGLVLVQDPREARYDGMPKSAIATNAVDLIVPAKEMPAVLDDYFSRRSSVDPAIETDAEFVERVIKHISYRTGHDFSHYKQSTMRRRLARRMSIVGAHTPQDYLQKLINNSGEANRLFHDILINVTSFFRDPQTFETVRQVALPRILHGRAPDDEIRIWVPGCSTGQEAYSIAMLVQEELSRTAIAPKVIIFATDIDKNAIQVAREGIFPSTIASEIPIHLLEHYFTSSPNGYTVNTSIREMVRLSLHSVTKDPPFSKLDLICCRNLLIYFDERMQEQAIQVFRYALKPEGYLFLGSSEGLGKLADKFITVSASDRLYQRTQEPAPPLPLPLMAQSLASPSPLVDERTSDASAEGNPERNYDRVILARHTPPFVVVNEQHDVIYSSGRTSRYLELPAGRSRLDIMQLAKDGLKSPLRTLLANPPKETTVPIHRDFDGPIDDQLVQLRLSVELLEENKLVIVFQDRFDVRKERSESDQFLPAAGQSNEKLIRDLESQLEAARQTIRTTVEELETSNEELKSSNEEMMSMNEELHSTNEELSTANDELKHKIEELNALNDDQRNLTESTRIATVFLDAELRIRHYTPEAEKYFRLVERDIGRPFDDIVSNLAGDPVIDICRRTLQTGQPEECERSTESGSADLLVRTYPYVRNNEVLDGVVITLTDVTEIRRYARQLEEARTASTLRMTEIEELYRVTPQAKALLDRNLNFLRVNQRMADIDGLSIQSHVGRRADDIIPQLASTVSSAERVFHTGEASTSSEVVAYDAKGQRRIWDIDWYPVSRDSEVYAVGVNIRDITEYKAMEVELRRLMRELQHRVKNMLGNVTALVNRARRESGDPKIVLETLVERIKALAATHNLLTAQNWRPTSLHDILEPELTAVYGDDRISLKGPRIHVNARTVLALSMAIHELATNAAKYGALSTSNGHLFVSWLRIDEGEGEKLVLNWAEVGDRQIVPPERSGFGTQLIRTTIEGSLGGTFECRFDRPGFACTLSIPFERATEDEGDAASELEEVDSSVR